jgi:hypothetical protein
MDELRHKVRGARRRLVLERFLGAATWYLVGTLALAAIAIAIPKFIPLGVDSTVWTYGWIGGACIVGVLMAAVWTWWTSAGEIDAAIEVDMRYGLRERVSSTLSLTSTELESDAGHALMRDAIKAVEQIDVAERFPVRLRRTAWLPLVPAALGFCLALLFADKVVNNPLGATTTAAADQKQVKTSTDVLKRKIAERRTRAEKEGLKDAEALFKKLEEGTRELNEKKDVDRKQALVKLNDLARQLENRRQSLGGEDTIRQHLNQLKKLTDGPASELAKALKDGDFNKALEELKKLQDELKNDKMDADAKAQLAKQISEMREKLQSLSEAHRAAMEDLQKQVQRARDAGNLAEAQKLQQMLDKLASKSPQMDQLQNMSEMLGQCAECMKQGDSQGAMEALGKLALDMEQMKESLDELAMLEEALDSIGQCKDSMGCKMCQGAGCSACMGEGFGDGDGLGEGQGRGARPEEETDTSHYDSQVRQTPGKGRAVITDLVDGPNVKGQVMEEIQKAVTSSERREADPLADRRLPKSHREHAKEFFEAFRKGE